MNGPMAGCGLCLQVPGQAQVQRHLYLHAVVHIIFFSSFMHPCLTLQVDLEEAKTQENAKLQSALQDIQLRFKETKELLAKEREAAKRAAEVVPVIQEVPVVDHAMLEKLTSENEKLKVRRLSLSLCFAQRYSEHTIIEDILGISAPDRTLFSLLFLLC